MQVIQIVPGVVRESSGPSYSCMRLTENLRAIGVDAVLATMDHGGGPEADFIRRFPIGTGPARLGRSPGMLRFLRQAAAGRSVETPLVLHSHGMWQMNAVYPGWVSARQQVPLVISPRGAFSEWAMAHGSRWKRLFWSLLQRPALRSAACFHVTSEAERRDVRRLGFTQPVALIPNGIDLPSAPLRGSTGGARTLLFLGRLHRVKGVDLLLEAWSRLEASFPDWSLIIAGDDQDYYGASGYRDQLVAQAAALGLSRVRFVGELLGEDKLRAYADADLFVLPSHSENFAVTVAEALAAGLPAIVSRGAPWSGLEAEGAGWWVDITPDALTDALRQAMVMNPAALAAMGDCGRAWMARSFAWNRIADEMRGTYQWILDRTRPVPSWIDV